MIVKDPDFSGLFNSSSRTGGWVFALDFRDPEGIDFP